MILRRFSTRLTVFLFAVVVLAFGSTTLYAKKAPEAPQTLQVQQVSERASYSTANKRIDSTTGETLAWYRINQPTSEATPELAARGFIQANATEFGEDTVSDMRLLKVKNSRGGHHVHLQQTFEGVPVYNAIVSVSMNRNRDITMVSANSYAGFSLATTSPSISSSTALTSTEVLLGAKDCLEEIPVVRLNGFRSEDGSDHLVWVVNYPTLEPMGDWVVIWDAVTGEHLATYDQMQYEDGQGMAFNPDPLTTAEVNYGGSYSDSNDSDVAVLNAERVDVDLLDITFSNGAYRLTGPFVNIFNFESPNDAPVTSATLDGFSFTRAEQGFEDVNVYYHIDTWQRHIQSLGFMDLQNLSIIADPHGLNGDDNSHYIPSQNRIAWGEGGVDDAEDADVVIHEYGHALHHAAVPGNWNTHLSSISEGFGDYEAVTYSARLSDYHNTWVFNWDGHNTFWGGRSILTGQTYPGGWGGNIYTNGTIWANALWLMRQSMDPDTADAIVFQGLYYQSASGTVVDAAQGLLQGELDLFDGRHRSEVYAALAAKGFVEPAGDITGTVTDVITEEAIAGALVELDGDESFVTASDDEGVFGFQSIVAGDYIITVSADGYGFYTEHVTVTSGGLLEMDVQLGNVDAETDPSEIEVTVPTNVVLDTSFTINNLGGPLEWGSKLRPVGAEPFEPFENFGEFGVQEVTGDNRIAGVTMLNGMLLVSGGNGAENPNKIYKLSADGTLLGSFDQPSTTSSGYYDLTTDGTLIYGSEGSDIVGFDINGVVHDTIPGPCNPNRALAYDPEHDWFWAADNSSGLKAVNRDGEVQVEIPFGTLVKGMGYFPGAPGGYKLYVSSAATGQLCRMSFFDPESGEYGGFFDLPYTTSTVYGSEVIAGLEGAEDLWLNAAITYTTQNGYRLTLEKLDWAVPYITLSPASGSIETQGEATVSMSIDGRMLAGDTDYEVELLIDYLNGEGSITLPITVHSQLVSAPETNLPTEFSLDPAYPNPFNPSTVLTLHLPQASDVKVAVFDILGRQVDSRTLQAMQAGTHKIEWAAPAQLASGVYFLTLDAGAGRTAAQKLVLMK